MTSRKVNNVYGSIGCVSSKIHLLSCSSLIRCCVKKRGFQLLLHLCFITPPLSLYYIVFVSLIATLTSHFFLRPSLGSSKSILVQVNSPMTLPGAFFTIRLVAIKQQGLIVSNVTSQLISPLLATEMLSGG